MPAPLPVRTDRDPAELRRLALREYDGRESACVGWSRAWPNSFWPRSPAVASLGNGAAMVKGTTAAAVES